MRQNDAVAFDVRGDAGRTLVRDPNGIARYFWIIEAPEMSDEIVAASIETGALTPCPLGPSLVSAPSPAATVELFPPLPPLASSE